MGWRMSEFTMVSPPDPLMVRAASEAMLAIANVIVAGDYGTPIIRDQLLEQLAALGDVVLAANGKAEP
jgi:hypothetical protein